MKKLTKITKELSLAVFITFGILILSHIDNSGREVRTFDLTDYFSKFKNNIDNVEVVDTYENMDEESDLIQNDNNFKIENTDSEIFTLKGTSSHYAHKFHGRMTANGETFNMNDYSAAHKKLPFGTILKIKNQKNNKSVLVRVNDRGPYVGDRILDLSYSAAKHIGDMGLPKIKAKGFDINSLANTDSNTQYLAFSEDKDFKIFEKNAVKITHQSDDFTKAVKAYRELKSKNNINNVYIFVPASNEYFKTKQFLIGEVNSSVLFANK